MIFNASLISNPKNSSGLCSFDVVCQDLSGGDKLIVKIIGSDYSPQEFKASKKMIIGLHTHLLRSGEHVVNFILESSTGSFAEKKVQLILEYRGGVI